MGPVNSSRDVLCRYVVVELGSTPKLVRVDKELADLDDLVVEALALPRELSRVERLDRGTAALGRGPQKRSSVRVGPAEHCGRRWYGVSAVKRGMWYVVGWPVFVGSSCVFGSQQCGQSVRGRRDVEAEGRRTFKLAREAVRCFSVFAFVFL